MLIHESTFLEFLHSSDSAKRYIIFKEIDSVAKDPLSVYKALQKENEAGSYFIETGETDHINYSYFCFNPQVTFCAYGQRSILTILDTTVEVQGNAFELMKQVSDQWRCTDCESLPPMIGGGVGFVSYDAVRQFEVIPAGHPDVDFVPDFYLQFHEQMVLIDHLNHKTYICIAVMPGEDPELDFKEATHKIHEIVDLLKSPFKQAREIKKTPAAESDVDSTDEEYCAAVKTAKDYIKAGDAFQIVLSRTFYSPCGSDPLAIYSSLRKVNPSPCMFLIQGPAFTLIGASPERLVSTTGNLLETMPIAGSRPRGTTKELDLRLAQELLADEKELAEHTMLVDLARNDLGSIAEVGSVAVSESKVIHRYSHIMHIVSRVTGRLKNEFHPLDALKATFPAGTLSGAPKIRAMEIIDELEKSRRGIYGGVIFTIDRKNNFDSFIAIRFIFLKNGIAQIRAGAGIVYDSVPQKEADETKHKAQAQLRALQLAEGEVI